MIYKANVREVHARVYPTLKNPLDVVDVVDPQRGNKDEGDDKADDGQHDGGLARATAVGDLEREANGHVPLQRHEDQDPRAVAGREATQEAVTIETGSSLGESGFLFTNCDSF